MPKIESEKIDCLYRPCSRPAPRGKVESVRTHSEVIEQFDSLSLLKLFFLVRKLALLVTKGFSSANDTPKPRKNCENGGFSTPMTGMKNCTVDRGCTPAPKDATNWRCSFAFFESFL